MDNLFLRFTAPVNRSDVLRHVHLVPAIPLVLNAQSSPSAEWRVNIRLAPRTTYAVVVDSTLQDVHGRTLQGPRRARVVTGDYAPSIDYAYGALTIPRTGARTLTVHHVNVRTIRVVSYRIPLSARTRVLAVGPLLLDRVISALPGLRPETTLVRLDGTFNVPDTSSLPLPRSIAPSDSTLVALCMEIADRITVPHAKALMQGTLPPITIYGQRMREGVRTTRYALLQATDIAVHARVAPGHTVAFVTGLLDGAPRSGATVRELDTAGVVVAQGVSGADGVVMLRSTAARRTPASSPTPSVSAVKWPIPTSLIEATLGRDRVTTPVTVRQLGFSSSYPLDPYQLGGRTDVAPAVTAALFSDRGIYRPGEMVYLKGVLRTGILGALALPRASDSARVTLTYRPLEWSGDEDVVVHDTVLAMTEFGTVADSLRLRSGATPGTYIAMLDAMVDGAWQTVAHDELRVAEYRAPEFLVAARTDSAPHYGGDTISVQVSANYLFGAPMARASVQWSAVLHEVQPWDVHIPGAAGWLVGEWDWCRSLGQTEERPHERYVYYTLNAAGHVTLRVPIADLNASRPGQVSVEVAVTDVNRQTVTASAEVPVHPAHLYVLARKQSRAWYWEQNKPVTIELRTVSPLGAELRDVPVAVDVVRHEWTADSSGDNGTVFW